MRFLVTMLIVLLPILAQDPPQKKGGGGRAPAKNLKVLTQEELNSGIMAQFVGALGVGQSGGCAFCHVQGPDRSSDDNPKKLTARAMISMVKEINANVGKLKGETGKTYVTCYTCHRGKNIPDQVAGAPLP